MQAKTSQDGKQGEARKGFPLRRSYRIEMGILVFGVTMATFSVVDSTLDIYRAHGRLTDWKTLLALCLNLALLAWWQTRLVEIRERYARWKKEREELDLIDAYISDALASNDWAKFITRMSDLGLRPDLTSFTRAHVRDLLQETRKMLWEKLNQQQGEQDNGKSNA